MQKKTTDVIRVSVDAKKELEALDIEVCGVRLETMDLKISHLLWFYKHYKNNNGGSNN